jgi:hypothetical protein
MNLLSPRHAYSAIRSVLPPTTKLSTTLAIPDGIIFIQNFKTKVDQFEVAEEFFQNLIIEE